MHFREITGNIMYPYMAFVLTAKVRILFDFDEWLLLMLACVKTLRLFAQQVLSQGSKCACTVRSRSHIKVICKGHQMFVSDRHHVLLSVQQEF